MAGHMTQPKTTAAHGRKTQQTAEVLNTDVAKPKSRLDYLQAADWETILVRTVVNALLFR